MCRQVDGVHVVGLPARVVRDMLLGPEGSSAVIGVRPSSAGSSLAAALAQRKPRSSHLTIAETDFGSVLRIPLVRQRLPALPQSIPDVQKLNVDALSISIDAAADGGSVSDGSNCGSTSGEYGLGISFSPGTHAVLNSGDNSNLRFYVLRLVAGGPAEMCGLIQVRSCNCVIFHDSRIIFALFASVSVALILFQPGDELISVDGIMVAGFSFARVRSAVVGAMGSVVELQVSLFVRWSFLIFSKSHVLLAQLLRASDGVSRRVFVPRCFPVGASSSGWSSMESERFRAIVFC